jgi:hypothetical protein
LAFFIFIFPPLGAFDKLPQLRGEPAKIGYGVGIFKNFVTPDKPHITSAQTCLVGQRRHVVIGVERTGLVKQISHVVAVLGPFLTDEAPVYLRGAFRHGMIRDQTLAAVNAIHGARLSSIDKKVFDHGDHEDMAVCVGRANGVVGNTHL